MSEEKRIGETINYYLGEEIYKVRIINKRPKNFGPAKGIEYTYRILQVISCNRFRPPEAGIEFNEWEQSNEYNPLEVQLEFKFN